VTLATTSNMEARLQWFWTLLALFALRASADCTSYGVDYSNGGRYNIDSSSNQYFSFISIFQGMCAQLPGVVSLLFFFLHTNCLDQIVARRASNPFSLVQMEVNMLARPSGLSPMGNR